MNYLCQSKEGKLFVMKNTGKDWSKYVGTSTYISLGTDLFFKVIQPINIYRTNEIVNLTVDYSLVG